MTVIKDIKLGESGANSTPEIVTSLKRSVAPTPHRFRDLLALNDFERHAQRRLPPMIHLYVAGAVETGASLRRAREAYQAWSLMPRMMRDVSGRSQQIELFGATYASPFGIARWEGPPSSPIAATSCWPKGPGWPTSR